MSNTRYSSPKQEEHIFTYNFYENNINKEYLYSISNIEIDKDICKLALFLHLNVVVHFF